MKKPIVAFICVHNSCRSQMAEALAKHYANDVFEAYSAGTHIKNEINKDAVRLIKEIYQIDMTKNQKNKLIDDIPSPDIVITMGCNVACPNLYAKHQEDWGLDDPSGLSDIEFKKVIDIIDLKVNELKSRILNNSIY